MFFANSYLGTKRFADIRNEARKKAFSGVAYIKTLFALITCVVASVSVIMVGYMLLNVIDVCGVLDGAPGAVWIALEFSVYFAVGFFVAMPLGCGWVRFLYTVTFDEDVSVTYCFCYFKNGRTYLRTLRFCVGFALKLLILISIFEGAGHFRVYLLDFFAELDYYIVGAFAVFFVNIVLILVTALFVFLMGRGFCSLAIFIRNDEISVKEILKASRNACRGKMWKIFLYKLAYLPHMALTVLSVLIYGGVYFAPLYTLAYFGAADELLASRKSETLI